MKQTRPLDGIRVLDLTHVLAGPFATGQLAMMGADVIRVERPAGDDFVRAHGGTDAMKAAGLGASFLSQNAGKRSVVIDLKSKKGRQVFFDLLVTADVITENFRPGVVDRLGIGFEPCTALKPDIIYASLSGFGPSGPLANRPAYDHILQGISGLMAMTGTDQSGPMRVGLPIVDYVAGQTLITAILAAFLQRAKTPETAQHLQISMLDAITTMMGAYALHHQATGQLRGLDGNRAFSDSPFSGRFETSNGQLVITANTPAQALRLCKAIDQEGLADVSDPADVQRVLRDTLLRRSADHWEDVLSAAHVPAARIRTLAEIMDHPQMQNSRAWGDLAVAELGRTFKVPSLAFSAPWQVETLEPAPVQGRDTVSILCELGYSPDQIATLHHDAVISVQTTVPPKGAAR